MNELELSPEESLRLFSLYLRVTGVAHTAPLAGGDPALIGKRLGLLHGSSWISLWGNYFGRRFLPGVHLVNTGNEALQMNFMDAHDKGEAVPPQANIDAFVRYATDLVEFASVDAVLITCSTMNRAFAEVEAALSPLGVPVVQIDVPMMERAVEHGGEVLVIATHGPTMRNTQALLEETAAEMGQTISYEGLTIEDAWNALAKGDVFEHNLLLAQAIKNWVGSRKSVSIVLAQLSMTALLLSYPNPEAEFGVPVFTSGSCGMEHMRKILLAI
jgi:aspartate/glutamate racemase